MRLYAKHSQNMQILLKLQFKWPWSSILNIIHFFIPYIILKKVVKNIHKLVCEFHRNVGQNLSVSTNLAEIYSIMAFFILWQYDKGILYCYAISTFILIIMYWIKFRLKFHIWNNRAFLHLHTIHHLSFHYNKKTRTYKNMVRSY